MPPLNGKGTPRCFDNGDAQGIVKLASVTLLNKTDQTRRPVPDAICAELGADTCTALGLSGRGHTPVLALCRRLVAAGHHPSQALHCYRRDVLCIVVASIGAAARLTVRSAGNGAPTFAIDAVRGGAGASLARFGRSVRGRRRQNGGAS